MARAWVNGALLDASAPAVRLDDPGFTVGDGVFTTTVVRDGRPAFLERNLSRLLEGLARVGLPRPDPDVLRTAVASLIEADQVVAARLRISVSAGLNGEPTMVVAHFPLRPQPATAATIVLPWRRNEHSPLTGVKSLSFGENLAGQRHLAAVGADEGILANTAGDLCEGLTSNVFLALGGQLITPSLVSGCLPGVVRAIVCDVTPVVEGRVSMADLARADEIFLTSATRGVQPVRSLDGRPLTAPGPLTAAAAAALARVPR